VNLTDAAKLVTILKALFPSWTGDKETAQAWMQFSGDMTLDEAVAAVDTLLANWDSQFPPSIGQIRKRANDLRGGVVDEHSEWDALLKKIRSVGSYRPQPELSPINEIIVRRLGGWIEVCSSELDDLQRSYHYQFEDAQHQVQIDAERERIAAISASNANNLTLPDASVTSE
jgi:hypothetical protein